MILGVSIRQWKNYKNFISMLQVVINENMNIIKKNQKIIEENLKIWSKKKIKLKVWEHLNMINKKTISKIKKVREEEINDNYTQLKFLTKG